MSYDFTNCKELINNFGGSEKKKKILYNNEKYMMKFPDPIREINNDLSYMNNTFSEYIGCHIFELCEIPAQKTMLGEYYDKTTNKNKVIVMCRSFENDNLNLVEFSKFLLSSNFDSKNSEKLELNDIINIFKSNERINTNENLNSFFDTLVVDALIGNEDRHQDNFGFVYTNNDDIEKIKYSPIYDCGSCLSPLLSDEKMKEIINNEETFKNQEYNKMYKYCENGKRIYMHQFYNNILKNNDLKYALLRIYPKINIEKIDNMINNTEYISDIRKEYLKKAIKLRYDLILTPAYKQVKKHELTDKEKQEIKFNNGFNIKQNNDKTLKL